MNENEEIFIDTTIKSIEYFIVKGAKDFYMKYREVDEWFLIETEINSDELDKICIENQDINQKKKQGLITEEEWIVGAMKDMLVRQIREFKADVEMSEENYQEQIRYFCLIRNIILGNMHGMTKMLVCTKKYGYVPNDIVKEIETEVYYNIAKFFANLGIAGEL